MEQPRPGWYFRTDVLVIALLCVGPLALPLLWWNPRFRAVTKVWVSVAVLVATWYSVILMRRSFANIAVYYRQIQEALAVPTPR